MTYAAVEPFGEQREELRHGQRQALMLNLKRDPKVKHTPWKPSEFMNFIEQPKEQKLTLAEEIKRADERAFGL